MSPSILLKNASFYALKPRFQGWLRPCARGLAHAGIHANQVTIATFLLSAGFGTFLTAFGVSRPLFLIAPVFLFARMALNAIDGMLAREFDQQSRLGAYLNELCDFGADAFCYLPFALVMDPVWIGVTIVLSGATEFAGALGTRRRYDGPMGKSDRAFLFGALGAWTGMGLPFTHTTGVIIATATAGLLATTVVNRVRRGLVEERLPLMPCLPGRSAQERSFKTHDGTGLFYRYWPAAHETGRAILLLHRGHEHSGRLQHVVDELNLPDFAMFAWDARGHGNSGLAPDSSPGMGTFVSDLDCCARHLSESYGIREENICVIAQSVGSVIAATWAHDFAPKIRAMILAAPAFKVRLYVPLARFWLRLMHRLFGEFRVNSYARPEVLTHDPERVASYEADPLITRPISVRVLLGLYSTSDRIIADAAAIHIPTQLLIPGSDWVVSQRPQLKFFDKLGSASKEKHVFPGFYHDVLGEKDRYVVIGAMRRFILESFDSPRTEPMLRHADQTGFMRTEFDRLRTPLPPFSWKRAKFAIATAAMKTGGRLSDGIRLGLATGFDSGSTLDYVYRNRASGIAGIGKLIDRFYLNSIGWRGIRERKTNLGRALAESIARLHHDRMPVFILDIAAGQGRYVLETVERDPALIEKVLLRDFSETNVQRGTALIRSFGLRSLVTFEKGDAFDRRSVAGCGPVTLGIISGLYELFPENAPVCDSLQGMAEAIAPGGLLVYTCQPYHPQLEMIARMLPSHRGGQPWIMRRRTQAEMDQLVKSAGFRKLGQRIDEWGMFSVSIAQREL
jgi:alpha-beta hydrolase superfamily lysophospholipase/phosphatidylglycerophosphate synthase